MVFLCPNSRRLPLAVSLALGLAACSPSTPPAEPGQATAPAVAEPAPIQLDASRLPPVARFAVADLDPAVAACSHLADHSNARWLAANPVPADRTTWGSFEMLAERSLAVQQQLVDAASAQTASGGIEKLIGDLWATGMDEAAINAAGTTPIQPELDRIAALTDSAGIAEYLRENFARGEGFLFSFGPEADFKDARMTIAYAGQGGLGLPDREYYLSEREDHLKARAAYQQHIAAVLVLGGSEPAVAESQAASVLAFETRLARVSMSSEELSRDVSKYYNPVSIADADALTPAFPWSRFFESQGLALPTMFSLAQPDFHKEVNAMLGEVAVAEWQSYLRFHTLDNAAPFLTDAFAEENFNFYGKTLRGQQEMQPRWKRVLNTLNGTAGEALGQLYVQHAFPPESKAKMQHLVDNLGVALKARLENLDWMGEDTRAKALEKLAGFRAKIGYPDRWRDWSGLITSRDSWLQNLTAANGFNYQFNLTKIGQPVDPDEWQMSPQTVNAYYHPLKNEIVFPAAILQPPFFDPEADAALNYGGIGGVIGHEMIHGFDDQGSRFDAKGNFANWWTDKDRQGFEERTGKLVAQFDAYTAIDGLHVNGKLTLGENIADLGGLSVAYSALQNALGNADQARAAIDGLSPEQRFFYNWSTVWRRNYKPEELKVRLTTDPHAPATYRAIGAPSNMPEFAAAFGCKDGDPMVRNGEQRVAIW